MNDFLSDLLIGFVAGLLFLIWQRLFDIGRTLQRIEILLQEATREADRIIVETGQRAPPSDPHYP